MGTVQTVMGPVSSTELGLVLTHEHVMVDFAGAEVTGPHRWDRAEVVGIMLPYLTAIARQGVQTLVECTPAYLGRDVELLQQLSAASGLKIITNTGFYKAPHLPAWVFGLEAPELAQRWIAEFETGIEGTLVRPGFIKIAVNPGELEPIQRVIVAAATITALHTGLPIIAHTASAEAAHESLDLVAAGGLDPARYVIAHADQIGRDAAPGQPEWDEMIAAHEALLQRGAWLAYDGIGWSPVARHVALVTEMLERGYESQLLISQDAGWYHVGEPAGGSVQPMTALLDEFVPALRSAGVNSRQLETLLVGNPSRLLAVAQAAGDRPFGAAVAPH
ncbi:MAG: phosphotriesterase family protein [Anaerolineae bacterium]|jgi:phosphotriesterase-related protein|nr:phosphotriesterase [Chloroflexota bacterium]